MTASGPFALGPARGERGVRISSTTTTTVRQATPQEMQREELQDDGEKSTSDEDLDDYLEFGPRQIKARKVCMII